MECKKTYKTTYKYDFAGNNTEIKDARTYEENLGEYTVKKEYDYANRIIKETNILGNYTTTEYDGIGRVKSKSDYLGRRTEYAYDSLSRLVQVTTPFETIQGATKSTFTKNYYDNNGNKIKELQRYSKEGQAEQSNTTEYGYDAKK
jgi:RHS Repeat.